MAVGCGEDEHEAALTRGYWLGRFEVTSQEHIEALQWAYGRGYITATEGHVRDTCDGNTGVPVSLDGQYCEITFNEGIFALRESPSSRKAISKSGFELIAPDDRRSIRFSSIYSPPPLHSS